MKLNIHKYVKIIFNFFILRNDIIQTKTLCEFSSNAALTSVISRNGQEQQRTGLYSFTDNIDATKLVSQVKTKNTYKREK